MQKVGLVRGRVFPAEEPELSAFLCQGYHGVCRSRRRSGGTGVQAPFILVVGVAEGVVATQSGVSNGIND